MSQLSDIAAQTWDVVVVGTGPAGAPFLMELQTLRPDLKILVVEFGKPGESGPNELDDSIKVKTPVHHHAPYECTNKGMGGSSATWGGRCVSYDEIDFIPRPVIGEECTWDVSVFEDVRRYYRKAAEYLDCGKPIFDLHEVKEVPGRRIAERFKEGDWLDSVLERWSLPTRIGKRYGERIRSLSNVTVIEGFRADRIGDVTDGLRSLSLVDRTTGEKAEVKAKRTVLAAGAQESTRLLFRSPNVFAGEVPDALGRYYQGHVSGKIASVKFSGNPKATDFGFILDGEQIYLRRRFQLSTAALKREDLLNTAIWLDNPLYYDPSHRSGTMSLIYLMMVMPVIGKKLAPPAIAESVTKGKINNVPGHLKNILFGFPKSLIEPFRVFLGRYLPERKLPGVFLYSPRNEYALHFHAEQQPIRENRMALAADGETLEMTYGYTDRDVESVIRTHQLLDEWLRSCGAGELVYWYSESERSAKVREGSRDGIHQVGTTRMSMRAEDGVLDPNLRVWGTDDLYVCSSSAFPTSGQANPTYLLTAFAVRLANHFAEAR